MAKKIKKKPAPKKAGSKNKAKPSVKKQATKKTKPAKKVVVQKVKPKKVAVVKKVAPKESVKTKPAAPAKKAEPVKPAVTKPVAPVPAPVVNPGKAKKIKAGSANQKKIIRDFIPMKIDIPTEKELAAITKKEKKEPKGKFVLEYIVHSSANILYEFLTTPSGLSEWFADDVNIRGGIYTFFWDGSQQQAKLIGYKEPLYVRFQWVDKNDGSYFEFKIEKDELTGDISLMITDFADEAEQPSSKMLWDTQIDKLMQVLGSY